MWLALIFVIHPCHRQTRQASSPTQLNAQGRNNLVKTDYSQMTRVRTKAVPTTPRQISKSQFKAQALALFREIETSGEAVVVTDHGRPALEVRPYKPTETDAHDPLQALRGCVIHYDDPLEPVADGDWEALA